MFQTKVVEKIKTHILCSVTFFSSENSAVYEIMWKNIVDSDWPQMKIRSMRIARCILKITETHSEYVTHCFSTATMVTRMLLRVTLYAHWMNCYEHCRSLKRSRSQCVVTAVNCCVNMLCSRFTQRYLHPCPLESDSA
jgi:hypothetical protein